MCSMSYCPILLGLNLLAAGAAFSGCGASFEADSGAHGSSGQAIMGGSADPGDTNVVDIVWQSLGGVQECSGSLVAPNLVLTAHHCVSSVLNKANGVDCATSRFAAADAVSNFLVSTKEQISSTPADFHTVREIVVPPGSTNTTFCGFDQAMLILSDDIQSSEAVPLVPCVDGEIAAKDVYTAIGFGSDGAGDSGSRRRLDGLLVDCVGQGCASIAAGQIDTQHEWIGDHGTCQGDSGGPALDAANRVIGVTSRGAAGCAAPIYGDVYSWADWIKQTAQYSASVGNYTAPPWAVGYSTDPVYNYPIGGACGSVISCLSNICLEDAAGAYCSRQCQAAAPCPTGYTCQTIRSANVCQRDPMSGKSGCNVSASEPAGPAPWLLGAAVWAITFRRRRGSP
jgi:MYXO-CTERM domain-containing protein